MSLTLLALVLAACTSPPQTAAPQPCTQEERDPRLNFEHIIDGKATPCDLAAYEAFLDSRQQVSGPWIQDVRIARSSDGLRFVEIPHTQAVRSAGVPEAVLGRDGRIYLYTVDGDLDRARKLAASGSSWFSAHGLVGHGALRLAVSDDGLSFQDVEEFGIVGGVRGMLVDPDVVALPDGRWRMYYVGVPVPELVDEATWQPGAKHHVFSAISSDLVRWEQEGLVVHGPYADPTVHCQADGRCLMLSFGIDHATSTDGGRSFDFLGEWGASGFAPELVALADGRLRVFWNDSAKGATIRSRISADGGLSWTEEEGQRLVDLYGEAPTVVQLADGSWLMYYHRFKPGEERRFGAGGELVTPSVTPPGGPADGQPPGSAAPPGP